MISSVSLDYKDFYYPGEKVEVFNPDRHNCYVSFKVDGELLVFHDKYGGFETEMSEISPDDNSFIIFCFDKDKESSLELSFVWEGLEKGQLEENIPVIWRRTYAWEDYFQFAGSDFSVEMKTYDLENGHVEGEFSGHIYKEKNETGESVHITDGFFYIKHEFNLPEVTITSPSDGETVSGDVTISGTAMDDSELSALVLMVQQSPYTTGYEKEINSNDWSITFDSTAFQNGESILKVYIKDEHNNRSRMESISVNISN